MSNRSRKTVPGPAKDGFRPRIPAPAPAPAKPAIAVGDVVTLKSGGLKMVVLDASQPDEIEVAFATYGALTREYLPQSALCQYPSPLDDEIPF